MDQLREMFNAATRRPTNDHDRQPTPLTPPHGRPLPPQTCGGRFPWPRGQGHDHDHQLGVGVVGGGLVVVVICGVRRAMRSSLWERQLSQIQRSARPLLARPLRQWNSLLAPILDPVRKPWQGC